MCAYDGLAASWCSHTSMQYSATPPLTCNLCSSTLIIYIISLFLKYYLFNEIQSCKYVASLVGEIL